MSIATEVSKAIGLSLVVEKINSYFKNPLSTVFKVNEEFHEELRIVIENTVEECFNENLKEIKNSSGNFKFFASQNAVEALLRYRIFKDFDIKKMKMELLKNKNIIQPTDEEINTFLQKFDKHLSESKNLRLLELEMDYKEEVFKISDKVDTIQESIDVLSGNSPQLIQLLKERLDNIKELIFKFKPKSALEEISRIEKKVEQESIEDVYIKGKIQFQKAMCFRLLGKDDDMNRAFIASFNINNSNLRYTERAAISYAEMGDLNKAKELCDLVFKQEPMNPICWFVLTEHINEGEEIIYEKIPKSIIENDLFILHRVGKVMIKREVGWFEWALAIMEKNLEDIELPQVIDYSNLSYWSQIIDLLFNRYIRNNLIQYSLMVDKQAAYNPDLQIIFKISEVFRESLKSSEVEDRYENITFLNLDSKYLLDPTSENAIELYSFYKKMNVKIKMHHDIVFRALTQVGQFDTLFKALEEKNYEDSSVYNFGVSACIKLNKIDKAREFSKLFSDGLTKVDYYNLLEVLQHFEVYPSTVEERVDELNNILERVDINEIDANILNYYVQALNDNIEYNKDNLSNLLEQLDEEDIIRPRRISDLFGWIECYAESNDILERYIDLQTPSLDLKKYAYNLHKLNQEGEKLIDILKTLRER
tara:strand:- start:2697 stop:4643 length:1947 start_codon:yes stop_codon:yes gene_type:complete